MKGRLTEILDEAFDWLGAEIVLAHAKNPPGIEGAIDVANVVRSEHGAVDRTASRSWRRTRRRAGTCRFAGLLWTHFYEPYLAGLRNAWIRRCARSCTA